MIDLFLVYIYIHITLYIMHLDESCHQLKILKMSTLEILVIHLYTKYTLNMGLKTLN